MLVAGQSAADRGGNTRAAAHAARRVSQNSRTDVCVGAVLPSSSRADT